MPPLSQPATQPVRLPPQIKYIIGNEACERFSYYGMVGILENYLKDRMHMGPDGATQVLHLFATAVYFLPLFGGWLADRWLGRYWTILSISLFYCLGHGALGLSEGSRAGLFIGLTLLAIGAGGIKPCVAAFVGDQFKPEEHHGLTRVYGWFYWSVNLGAAAAYLVIPYLKERFGYGVAFGVPGFFMALATLFFWLGRKQYVRQPPAARMPNRPPGFLPVLWYVLTHQGARQPGQKFFDVGLARYDREAVDGARAVLRIVAIFATIPMFWALFNQVNSTWVLQGNKMVPLFIGDYKIDGERMQAAGAVLVMIWVPVFTFLVFPFLERIGWLPTALRRMSVGMVLGAVSFVVCGAVQSRLDHGATLSVAWQIAPYIVLEAGEVLVSATALEFAFSQAPASMKSIIMSFYYMTIAGGHFLVAVFTNLKQHLVHSTGAAEFYFFSLAMFVVAGIFIFIASRFRGSDK
jgi:proton-dependent oligopeptide transporter, POT family